MRPLSVGEILDASFSAFRRNFGALFVAMLAIVVPTSILETLVLVSVDSWDSDALFGRSSLTDSSTPTDGETAAVFAFLGLVFLNMLLAPAACLRLIGGDILGQKVTARESLAYAVRRLPRVLWVSLLYGVTVFVGLLFFILPGIWLGVMLVAAIPAALYEDAKGTKALSRSAELLQSHWWRTFGVLLVMTVIVLVIQNVIGLALLGALADSDNDVLGIVLFTLVNIVSYALSLPLVAAAMAYVYFDLRVRKEGFDLQVLASRIGEPQQPAATHPSGLPAPDEPPRGGFLPPRPPGG